MYPVRAAIALDRHAFPLAILAVHGDGVVLSEGLSRRRTCARGTRHRGGPCCGHLRHPTANAAPCRDGESGR